MASNIYSENAQIRWCKHYLVNLKYLKDLMFNEKIAKPTQMCEFQKFRLAIKKITQKFVLNLIPHSAIAQRIPSVNI